MSIRSAAHRFVFSTPIWVVFIIVLSICMVASYWLGLRNTELPDAFRLPPQVVMSRVPGIAGPAVRLGDPVVVQGTKCNITDKTLIGHGAVSWISIEPPGVIEQLPSSGGAAWGPHQCVTRTFVNPMPVAVISAITTLHKYEKGPIMWAITGSITADHYAQQQWVTKPFRVVVP